jgi:hypothetical protein
MSLNPKDDLIAKFRRSNQGYLDNLSPEARKALEELIDLCYPYLASINAKGEPFEDESVEITMMLVQQLIIEALKEEDSKAQNLTEALHQVFNKIDNIDGELQDIRNIITEALTKKKNTALPAEFQSTLEVK